MYVMYKTVLTGCAALSGVRRERDWVSSFDAPKQNTYTYTYTLGGNHEPGHHIPRWGHRQKTSSSRRAIRAIKEPVDHPPDQRENRHRVARDSMRNGR